MAGQIAIATRGALQCSGCRQAFADRRSFDRHLVGERCAVFPEILTRDLHPMQNGIWRVPKPTNRYEELSNAQRP